MISTKTINIIDIKMYPILQELREKLFEKNSQVIDLVKEMDTCGQLECLNDDDSYLIQTLSNPNYIKFSFDKPYDTFGKYNKYDLIKVAAELASKIENSSLDEDVKSLLLELLEMFLRDRENSNKSFKERMNKIKDALKEVSKEEYKDIFEGVVELEKTAENIKFDSPILGIYSKEDNSIILFLNNILHKCSGNESFSYSEIYSSYLKINKEIERTYVHELFHMIHFSQEWEVADGDFGYQVVIEGLARYFEIYYSEKYLGTNAQKELDDLNDRYSVVSYPYAGACYIHPDCCLVPIPSWTHDEFGNILEKTYYSANKFTHLALHCLLQGTKELEIIIKNL